MVQLNPVPVFGAKKKNTSTIWRKFFNEISVQMVSAPKPSERWSRLVAVAAAGSNWFDFAKSVVDTKWPAILAVSHSLYEVIGHPDERRDPSLEPAKQASKGVGDREEKGGGLGREGKGRLL